MFATLIVMLCSTLPDDLPSFADLGDFLANNDRCHVETASDTLGPEGELLPLGFYECLTRGQMMAADLAGMREHGMRLARYWCVPLSEKAVWSLIFRPEI